MYSSTPLAILTSASMWVHLIHVNLYSNPCTHLDVYVIYIHIYSYSYSYFLDLPITSLVKEKTSLGVAELPVSFFFLHHRLCLKGECRTVDRVHLLRMSYILDGRAIGGAHTHGKETSGAPTLFAIARLCLSHAAGISVGFHQGPSCLWSHCWCSYLRSLKQSLFFTIIFL